MHTQNFIKLVVASLLCALAILSTAPPVRAAGINQRIQEEQQQHRLRQHGLRVVPLRMPGAPPQPLLHRTAPEAEPAAAEQSTQRTTDELGARYTYDSVGNRESAIYPNGMTTRYRYDRRNRLIELHTSRNGTTIHRYHYTLDASGLRTRVDALEADGATRITVYTYDAVKRLTEETQSRNGAQEFLAKYSYDRNGNRIKAIVNGITTDYRYDANDRLIGETTSNGPAAGTVTYTYDDAGNQLAKTGPLGYVDYRYDDAGRLSEAHSAEGVLRYAYDHSGLMIGKTRTPATGPATTWRYVWDTSRGIPQTIEELSAQGNGQFQVSATYLFGDDLIAQTRNGVTNYVIADGAGDTRALADAGGAITDTYAYDAWGNVLARTGSTPIEHLYRGERLDPNTGFYYLRARWMDPTVGRFTQMDAYQGSVYDPPSLHKYQYSNADPVNRVDPTGRSSELMGSAAAVGVAAIIATAATMALNIVAGSSGSMTGSRRFGVWDAVTLHFFRANVRSRTDPIPLVATQVADQREGHHTVPVYLCGSMAQETADVLRSEHVTIHLQLGALAFALRGAEFIASHTIGRRRHPLTLKLAQTAEGRTAIAQAIHEVYDIGNWWGAGLTRKIGDVFPNEKAAFVAGKTSLPWCTRWGTP